MATDFEANVRAAVDAAKAADDTLETLLLAALRAGLHRDPTAALPQFIVDLSDAYGSLAVAQAKIAQVAQIVMALGVTLTPRFRETVASLAAEFAADLRAEADPRARQAAASAVARAHEIAGRKP